MGDGQDTQGELVAGYKLGDGCVVVTPRVWYRDDDGVRAVFVDNKPFLTYSLQDPVAHRLCAAQLVEAGV